MDLNPLYRSCVMHKNELADLRHPGEGQRRRSSNSVLVKGSRPTNHCLDGQIPVLTVSGSHHNKKSLLRRKNEGAHNGFEEIEQDPLTCGLDRFSDALLNETDHKFDGKNCEYTTAPLKSNLQKDKLGHVKSYSNSNISISSVASSHRRTSSHLPHLKQDLTLLLNDSQNGMYNTLAKQFLETTSKSVSNRETPQPISRSSASVCAEPVGVSEFLSTGFINKMFPLFSSKKDKEKDEEELDTSCKDVPEYFLLDYIKHIQRDLNVLEFKLKHFLMKLVLPGAAELNQTVAQMDRLSDAVKQLHTDISSIKSVVKDVYQYELNEDFDRSDPLSFVSKFLSVVDNHVNRLEALEKKTVMFQNELEARKVQLRKLEDLIKLNDMVVDLKRNMKMTEKLKEYYGPCGDCIILGLSTLLLLYFLRCWFT